MADLVGCAWLNSGVAPATEDEVMAEFNERRKMMNKDPFVRSTEQKAQATFKPA